MDVNEDTECVNEDTEWFITPIIIEDHCIFNDIELESVASDSVASDSVASDSVASDSEDMPPTPPTTPTTPTINTYAEANQIKLNKCRIISYCNNSS